MDRRLAQKDSFELQGLTSREVEKRVHQGKINTVKDKTSRTYGQILERNICP